METIRETEDLKSSDKWRNIFYAQIRSRATRLKDAYFRKYLLYENICNKRWSGNKWFRNKLSSYRSKKPCQSLVLENYASLLEA